MFMFIILRVIQAQSRFLIQSLQTLRLHNLRIVQVFYAMKCPEILRQPWGRVGSYQGGIKARFLS